MKKVRMMKVDINKIEPNPYRDFDLYPIVDEQVESLMEGLSVRDFGTIAIRPSVYGTAGNYEQVFGHHRLEAMKRLGFTEVDCKVEAIDDDQLIREMTDENTKQQGNNVAAQIDSVAAIVNRLAYVLLISDDFNHVGKILPTSPFENQKSFEIAKGLLLKGDGIGKQTINKYAPSIKIHDAANCLAVLKDSGKMTEIITNVQKQIDAELQAEAEIEAERAKEAERLRKAQAKAEAEAKKAQEEAEKKAKIASAARKAKAEQEAKDAKIKAEKLAKLREKAAKEEAAKKAKAKAEAEKKAEQVAAAKKAAEEFEEKARGLNPKVLHLMKKDGHLEAFRRIMVSTLGQKYFPKDTQVALYEGMIEAFKKAKHKVTAAEITKYLTSRLNEMDAHRAKMAADREARLAKEKVTTAVSSKFNKVRAALGALGKEMGDYAKMVDNPSTRDYALRLPRSNPAFMNNLDSLEEYLQQLRTAFNIRDNSITNGVTVDNADTAKEVVGEVV